MENSDNPVVLNDEALAEVSGGTGKYQFPLMYTVVKGDWLSKLSLEYYGSSSREAYMVIYNANSAVIGPDPNLIQIGMNLVIPPYSASKK